jgi:hypothetical protein
MGERRRQGGINQDGNRDTVATAAASSYSHVRAFVAQKQQHLSATHVTNILRILSIAY